MNTTSTVTPISETPKQPQQRQTAKDIIAANVKTILQILKMAVGWHHGLNLKIENPPYMALVIEATDESGPCGLPAISVCHYGEQNDDLMRDPEMCFELGFADGPHLNAFYYRWHSNQDSGL